MSEPLIFPSPLVGEGVAQRRMRGNPSISHILIFDSGLGGMSVYTEIEKVCPHATISYLADDAIFPYGALSEDALVARVMHLMGEYIPKLKPDIVVIACNTASTLVLPPLRARFSIPFIGTVPAIKPAAERSKSGMFSVLATPGTVARDYTKELIRLHAKACDVTLVGAKNLARIAEEYMNRHPQLFPSPLAGEGAPKGRERGDLIKTNMLPSPQTHPTHTEAELLSQIRVEIAPAFVEKNGISTDIIVLACTHYPLILPLLQQASPWQVEWINPAKAIAKRVVEVLKRQTI